MLTSDGKYGLPLASGGAAPPPPLSLCLALVGEEEEQYVKNWCRANDHDRDDYFENRLSASDELRLEGNALLKASKFDQALLCYLAAIWQLDYEVWQQMELNDEHQIELDTKKLKVISNTNAVYLKLAQEAAELETIAPEELAECLGLWEDVGEGEEGLLVEDFILEERAARKEAHKQDPDIIDFSEHEQPLAPKPPRKRKKLPPNLRKIEYYRFVKTTAVIGLKHMSRMNLFDKEIEAKFRYRAGIAEFERGFSEPAYDAFKEANQLLPGDRDIRQALAKARAAVEVDRAEAKAVWQGKLDPQEAGSSQGLRQWLVPRQLIGWVRQRVAGGAPADGPER